tara:strand:+ start:22 stop:159 length:138 start_codon:yes stop_codon:yes gene_type:complete
MKNIIIIIDTTQSQREATLSEDLSLKPGPAGGGRGEAWLANPEPN